MNDDVLNAIVAAIRATALHGIVIRSTWLWPMLESLHFIGMSLLIGTIGMFDLRLMGFAPRVPIAAMHRLIPIGIGGFLLNATTGLVFIAGFPEQYIFNTAFRVKVVLILAAGLNVLFFYTRVFRRIVALADGDPPPRAARIVGAVSFTAWVGVMTAGRLLTFFRPPF